MGADVPPSMGHCPCAVSAPREQQGRAGSALMAMPEVQATALGFVAEWVAMTVSFLPRARPLLSF